MNIGELCISFFDRNQDATSKTEQHIKQEPARVTSLKCWMMLSAQINALLIRQNIISPVHHELQWLNQLLKWFFNFHANCHHQRAFMLLVLTS